MFLEGWRGNHSAATHPRQIDPLLVNQSTRSRTEHENAIGEKDGFVHIVSNQENGMPFRFPVIGQPGLHRDPVQGIECTEWFIEQK